MCENYLDEQTIDDYNFKGLSLNILSCIGSQFPFETYAIPINPDLKMRIFDIIMQFINEFDLGVNVNAVIFAKFLEKIKKVCAFVHNFEG
jgi:hypothetical protein